MAPKRAFKEPADVLARKGYYEEMTQTFEEIHEKRGVVEKELQGLVDEKSDLEARIKALQGQLDALELSNKANLKARQGGKGYSLLDSIGFVSCSCCFGL